MKSSTSPISTLSYYSFLKVGYYILNFTALIFVVGAVFLTLLNFVSEQMPLGIAIFFCFIALVLWAEGWFLFRPMVFSSIKVFEDRIELNRIGKIQVIAYDEIEKIKINYIPYLGGGFAIKPKNKRYYRFTVVLKQNYKLIEAIFDHSPSLMDARKKENFCRFSRVFDMGFQRLGEKYTSFSFMLLRLFIIPMLAAVIDLFWESHYPSELVHLQSSGVLELMPKFLWFFGLSIIVNGVFEYIQEVFDMKRLKQVSNVNEFSRSPTSEALLNKVEVFINVLLLALYIVWL